MTLRFFKKRTGHTSLTGQRALFSRASQTQWTAVSRPGRQLSLESPSGGCSVGVEAHRIRCPVGTDGAWMGTLPGEHRCHICAPCASKGGNCRPHRQRCPARPRFVVVRTATAPGTAPCAPKGGTADGTGNGALRVSIQCWYGLPTALRTAPCASHGGESQRHQQRCPVRFRFVLVWTADCARNGTVRVLGRDCRRHRQRCLARPMGVDGCQALGADALPWSLP